jgi:hypothetical protein
MTNELHDSAGAVESAAGTSPIRVSIIIEWKNQDLAADERADAMLAALARQWPALADADAAGHPRLAATALAPTLEILFVYDGAAARRNLEGQLAGRFAAPAGGFAPRLVEGAGLSYYEMKHLGAGQASGDILIFLDSDVVPEPGWLAAMLDAVLAPGVPIVCGNTYIDPVGLLGKAFALAWFFPLRATETGLTDREKCYSNNLAIRAELYRDHPFIEVPGTTRAAMPQLRERLAAQGIAMHKCRHAQVTHPHPRGLAHFLKRALVHGRDIYLKTNHDAGRDLPRRRLGDTLAEIGRRYAAGMGRALREHRRVELTPAGVPAVLAIMSLYYLVFAAGSLATHLAPGPMSRGLRI